MIKIILRVNLKYLPLNALDEKQFEETVNRFPDGDIVIVNEGLLMYLSDDEKLKVCSNIRNVLKKRGGYWITADIYITTNKSDFKVTMDDEQKKFFEQHNIEENKFEDFESAEKFFLNAGLEPDKIAEVDRSKLSAIKYLIESATPEQLIKIRSSGKIQATWRLHAVD